MKFFVVSAFPRMFEGVWDESILRRAQEKALVQLSAIDLREFADDKHNTLDDYPIRSVADQA